MDGSFNEPVSQVYYDEIFHDMKRCRVLPINSIKREKELLLKSRTVSPKIQKDDPGFWGHNG